MQLNTSANIHYYERIQESLKNPSFRNLDHSQLLAKIHDDLQLMNKTKNAHEIDSLNLFRVLRNLCVNSRFNQDCLLKMKIPNHVIEVLIDDSIGLSSDVKTVGLQFIGNMLPGNPLACNHMWSSLYPNLLHYFLSKSSFCDKHFVICSMILYNCLIDMPASDFLFDNETGKNLVLAMCDAVGKLSDADWVVMLIGQHFFKVKKFFSSILSQCSVVSAIGIFQLLSDMLDEDINSNDNHTIDNDFLVVFLCENFLERCHVCIQSPSLNLADLLVSIIEALCRATAFPGHWNKNTAVSKVIDSCIELLRDIHLQKGSINHSSEFHLYGYLQKQLVKRSIIRVIGNICFENENVQNRVRLKGGIPLILESCKIDDDNPLIQQWAIFALRNLCQNNLENQAEVAKFEKVGIADSPVLKSMGLTVVENEKGKMSLTRINE